MSKRYERKMMSLSSTTKPVLTRTLETRSKKCSVSSKRRLQTYDEKVKKIVHVFLSKDDNTRQMPGKSDTKKTDGGQKQQKVLCDSLRNLYLKYNSENDEGKMSFATFCRLRPQKFSLTKYISNKKCLCQIHQNMAFLLKGIKASGVSVPLSPEDYAKRW